MTNLFWDWYKQEQKGHKRGTSLGDFVKKLLKGCAAEKLLDKKKLQSRRKESVLKKGGRSKEKRNSIL